MTANVLNAIAALSRHRNNNLGSYANNYAIKINAVGEKLEYYVKDLLTGQFYLTEKDRNDAYGVHYSYLGNQNNAVDAIAKNGDAFEIKKVETRKDTQAFGKIALNNSPPKDVLHRNDPRLRADIRDIKGVRWVQKDIFYAVGSTAGQKVKYLYFVQGTCFAARSDVYQRVFDNVRKMIKETVRLSNIEFKETKELGRIYRVDPMGITDFRMRGMWEIKHPADVFGYVAPVDRKSDFTCFAIMEEQKFYDELSRRQSDESAFKNEIEGGCGSLDHVDVNDPNNPANRKKAVLIKVSW